MFIPLAGLIDLDAERERLLKEIAQKERFLLSVQKKLHNQQFVTRAPADIVERERNKEHDAIADLLKLRDNLATLNP